MWDVGLSAKLGSRCVLPCQKTCILHMRIICQQSYNVCTSRANIHTTCAHHVSTSIQRVHITCQHPYNVCTSCVNIHTTCAHHVPTSIQHVHIMCQPGRVSCSRSLTSCTAHAPHARRNYPSLQSSYYSIFVGYTRSKRIWIP